MPRSALRVPSVASTKELDNSLLRFSPSRQRTSWLNAFQGLSTTRELGNDGFHRGRPDERFRVLVPDRQELCNGLLQVGHAGKRAAANALARQLAKPALDQVQPTRTRGYIVADKARVALQPSADV